MPPNCKPHKFTHGQESWGSDIQYAKVNLMFTILHTVYFFVRTSECDLCFIVVASFHKL